MNKLLVVFLISFLLTNISASCKEGQIDINTASAEKLDEIVQIGTSRAEQIIALRPFESVDDLVRVSGINGDGKRLEEIKTQGLACVNGQEEEDEAQEETLSDDTTEEDNEIDDRQDQSEQPEERETIILNPQVIKSENDNENLSKSNYAIYGLVFFCVLLVVLFILRKNKYNKNEFR